MWKINLTNLEYGVFKITYVQIRNQDGTSGFYYEVTRQGEHIQDYLNCIDAMRYVIKAHTDNL